MSSWLVILVSVVALGVVTYVLGEWLSDRLVSSRTPGWLQRQGRRSDPLAERDKTGR